MNRLGLTNEVLIEKYLIRLLSANVTICIREKRKTRRVSILDHGARQRALDMAFKLSGAYAPTNLKLAETIGDDIEIIDMPSRREGTLSQLERLQRIRNGQPVPPTLNVNVSA
jgi:hypothetical protein